MAKKLTTQERRFVEFRASGLNATKAIRAAGFKGKRPDLAASKVNRRPHVQAALEALMAKIAEKAGVTQEDWFREVWAVASHKVRGIKPSDKTKALELAGRHLGAFKDTAGEREVIGPGLTIVIQQGAPQVQSAQVPVTLAPGVALMPGPER